MPTVLRQDGFSFRIYPNDHLPAHVRIFKAEGQAKIDIESELPTIIEMSAMSKKDVKRMMIIVVGHRAELLAHWRELHG